VLNLKIVRQDREMTVRVTLIERARPGLVL
jgi:hypothetical protein